MTNRLGDHAIVIGGSMAGLMTGRVLADYFDHVTVFERDEIETGPVIHKSIPQGNHVHALLYGGQRVMSQLYPGFIGELKELGAVPYRSGVDVAWYGPQGKSYSPTGSVREPHDLGFVGHTMSRGLLEHLVRLRTTALPNVTLEIGSTVEELVQSGDGVRGVIVARETGSETVNADLVVDAGGRGSHALRWLTSIGVPRPSETVIGVDFAYTSTKYRIRNSDNGAEPVILVGGPPPDFTRGAGVFEIEEGTRHVSLAGRFGDYPPTDDAGFLAFAKSLPASPLFDLIESAERIADITHHRFPTSMWRHYEGLADFPPGFLLVGDAICSFNPVYGQGMTSAALQTFALQEILGQRLAQSRGLERLAREFFAKAAEVIATPWALAAALDFAYPQTRGERPAGMSEGARYFAALDSLQSEDRDIQRLILEVFQLMKPLSALSEEPLRNRVLERMQKRKMGG